MILLVSTLCALAVAHDPDRAWIVAEAVSGRIAPPLPRKPDAEGLALPSLIARAILAAAKRQIGVTFSSDPSHVALAFPGGDVPPESGVCSDGVIRAAREGLRIDLQPAVNREMSRAFAAYPALWVLIRPDPDIDHRPVPNLQTLPTRAGAVCLRFHLGRNN